MTKELTALEVDKKLANFQIGGRWCAQVEGYSITYLTLGFAPQSYLAESLLRLRAVIDAIDASGSSCGAPLQSYYIPLLVHEYSRLQGDICRRITSSKGGEASRGKARSATVAVLRAMFGELGRDESTNAYFDWLESGDNFKCECQDDTFNFYSGKLKPTKLTRRAVSKAISRERKRYR